MSTLQILRVFLNERLTAAAVEIFGAVEKTVVEYQEENDRLRRLLRIAPDIKLCREESLQLSVAVTKDEVPPKQQHSEQEWRTSLQQEDREPTQIKEEQEELWTCQEEEQLQEQEDDIIVFKFPPICVKSKCDQENTIQSFSLPQPQTVENRDSNSKPVELPHFVTVTHLEGLDIPCDPPDNQNNAYSHSSTVSSNPVGLDSSSPLNYNPSMREHCPKPSTTSRKTHRCCDCGEIFALTVDLQGHVTLSKKRPSECRLCKIHYNSTCKLKAHIRLCHMEKPCTCPFCGKTFKLKGHLSRHMRIHTGEKPFGCGDCGKSFIQKGDLRRHALTHTGEKPFSCGECGKSFNRKGNLNLHILTHTGANVHKECKQNENTEEAN
uniref:zinc finger protein 629-like n=1 Tax=Oncorhynchus gorbuscha TaxID=8017 RepID=UPI001EAF7142|nr:zinc finger protein 629-like [Oncorhynchus gorbuscha]